LVTEFKGGISHDEDKQLDTAPASETTQAAEKHDTVA
jgi:hypothetical protein